MATRLLKFSARTGKEARMLFMIMETDSKIGIRDVKKDEVGLHLACDSGTGGIQVSLPTARGDLCYDDG
ncbi:hypothetical protein N7533_003651 [Penicillium manginii]|jgi:hypothetical protein|uniref:uncharacterized protein n=1 Tax=Penicillium manginii TaxID=203109 RepID=UPI00254971DA|nr:uncharacterized protein N7533_003651 [Penicillium manginii]KAJ5761612.1 hypothetical protein N7533_003651 [Penicillium manginii]